MMAYIMGMITRKQMIERIRRSVKEFNARINLRNDASNRKRESAR